MKRNDKSPGDKEYFRRRRAQFRPWLKAVGLDGVLEALPKFSAEFLLSRKYPAPEAVFENAPSWWGGFRKKLYQRWREIKFEPFEDGVELPAIESLTIYTPMINNLHAIMEHPTNKAILDRFGPPPELRNDVVLRGSATLGRFMRVGLGSYARIDGPLFELERPTIERRNENKPFIQWRISAAAPEVDRALPDGKGRPIFRVAETVGLPRIKWVEMDGSVLGLSARTGKLPVYVQSHALERLSERLRFWPGSKDGPQWCYGLFQDCLAQSMENPRIARQSGREFLVEYMGGSLKLGYLVAELIGRKVVIRTFLLCGMQGTPEGRQLERRLKLSRSQIEWLYLDHLEQWSTSDLRHDPEIRPVLEECGLKDLLQCADQNGWEEQTELAGTFRKFVGEEQLKKARIYFGLEEGTLKMDEQKGTADDSSEYEAAAA